jgi:pimeloyl-ACP methyl ester carboxylesterase
LISDLVTIIDAEDRGAPIYVAGWCWGALPAINLASDLGTRLRGLVLLTPGLFPSSAIRSAALEHIVASKAADVDAAVVRSPLTEDMFSDDTAVQNFIRQDGLTQWAFTPRLFRISRELSQIATARLPELVQPVLLLLAAHDCAVDNQQTVEVVQRLPKKPTIVTLPCNHGMQFEVPEQIAAHISRWLESQGPVAVRRAQGLQ